MESTILTIESGNNTFYFDKSQDNKIKVCRDETYLRSFDTLGEAFEYFYNRYNDIVHGAPVRCIGLKLTRIETTTTDRIYSIR